MVSRGLLLIAGSVQSVQEQQEGRVEPAPGPHHAHLHHSPAHRLLVAVWLMVLTIQRKLSELFRSHTEPGMVVQCRIIQGPAALSAQLLLLTIVLTALAIKRHRERPRRPLNIWGLDLSKQAFSSGAGHLCGMGIAVFAHRRSGGASECAWYLCIYLLDCTLGITTAITLHKVMARLARLYWQRLQAAKDDSLEHHWVEALLESGNYGDPPNLRRWAIQVVGWVSCVVTARLTVGGVLLALAPLLAALLARLDRGFAGHQDLQLFLVMVGLPMLLNVGQAWIQDQVLKWKHKRTIRRVVESDETTPFLAPHPAELQQINGTGGGGGGNRARGAAADKVSNL